MLFQFYSLPKRYDVETRSCFDGVCSGGWLFLMYAHGINRLNLESFRIHDKGMSFNKPKIPFFLMATTFIYMNMAPHLCI